MTRVKDSEDSGLLIDENALDREVIHQADRFRAAGELAAVASSREDLAKSERDRAWAQADHRARRRMEKADRKSTEAEIRSMAEEDEDYRKAVADYLSAKLAAERAYVHKDAWQMRSSMLRDLVRLWEANYFSSASAGSANAARNNDDAVKRRREQIARKRKELD